MKKLALLFTLVIGMLAQAQVSSNRFFYELTIKPKKDSTRMEKVMTVLDITDKKSIYRDLLVVSQDSIIKNIVDEMKKTGVFKDITKIIKKPKFSYKITKSYPINEIFFTENILNNQVSYSEVTKINWKISNEKLKIGEYNTQKATADFGGRKWTAWFSSDIPLQDGPYKFHGLPGLIVKIVDQDHDYAWELKANKIIKNYEEQPYSEKLLKEMGQSGTNSIVSREKFNKMLTDYKENPFGSIRDRIKNIDKETKLPDGRLLLEVINEQEMIIKNLFNENYYNIEKNY
jgi:GLPGLI family protein